MCSMRHCRRVTFPPATSILPLPDAPIGSEYDGADIGRRTEHERSVVHEGLAQAAIDEKGDPCGGADRAGRAAVDGVAVDCCAVVDRGEDAAARERDRAGTFRIDVLAAVDVAQGNCAVRDRGAAGIGVRAG